MSSFTGKSALIRVADMDALSDRLKAAGVRVMFVNHPIQRSDLPDVVEVRYEATPRATQYVNEFRLPPDFLDED